MIPLFFVSWLALGIVQTEVQAQAQPPLFCLPRPAMLQVLMESGHQRLIGKGPTPRGALIELYVDDKSGSWTFLAVRPDGVSCVLAGGRDGWEIVKEPSL